MLLWPFNKYPGTDYETFNWEWILKTVKEYTAKVDDFIEDINDTWNTFRNWVSHEIANMHRDFAIYVNATEGALNTGAIADGAITYAKLNEILKIIVTPEMFGAQGDGVTDDSDAFIDALNSGKPVYIKNTYNIGSVDYNGDVQLLGNKSGKIIGTLRVFGDLDISDCVFEAASNASTYTIYAEGEKTSIKNTVVDGLDISKSSCITIFDNSYVNITGCTVKNNMNGRDGIAVISSENINITDNYITRTGGSGIQLYDICNNAVISNNELYNTNMVDWGGQGGSDGCISTYGDTSGMGYTSSKNILVANNTIQNDTAGWTGGCGIRFNGVEDGIIDGNIIDVISFHGILIADRVHTIDGNTFTVRNKNVKISNNIINMRGQYQTVFCRSGDDITIKNNSLTDKYSGTSQKPMITIGGGGVAPDMVEISNNTFESDGNTVFPISGNVATNVIFKNNHTNTGRGSTGVFTKLWLLNNEMHNKAHTNIVNITEGDIVCRGNLYSYINNVSGNLTFGDNTNVVVNEYNTSDVGMY